MKPEPARRKAPGLRSEPALLLLLSVVLVLGGAWFYAAARPAPRASAAAPGSLARAARAGSVAHAATSRAASATARASAVERPVVPVLEPRVSERALSAPPEQGHGAEIWQRSDDAEQLDFEPRFALDAGPLELSATPPAAFH
ncbi:MAG: hypothetical protein ABW217_15865 [Polyangiaceae bacterium]